MSQTISPFSANRKRRMGSFKRVGAIKMQEREDGDVSKQSNDDDRSPVSTDTKPNGTHALPGVGSSSENGTAAATVIEEKKSSSFLSRMAQSITGNGSKSFAIKPSSAVNSNKRRKSRPFLTSSQLTDLFNRLDRNGDGSLDLDEFTDIVQMLQLQVDEEYISKIFLNFKKDSLTMQEFICAYQQVYSNQIIDENVLSHKYGEDFIRATRYGVDEDGERLFELYLIERKSRDSNGGSKSRKIKFNLQHEKEGIVRIADLFESTVEEVWEGDIESINKMVHRDSKVNGDEGCRILWWIDIAVSHMEPSSIHKYVGSLGIPNNSKFLSNFSNFGSPLGKDPKSRIFLGSGVTVDGLISSMNVFVQTVALKDRPIVHHFPAWIENQFKSIQSKAFQYLKEYYVSRFAFVFNLSSLSNTNEHEKFISYDIAEKVSKKLREDVFHMDDDTVNEEEDDEAAAADVPSKLTPGDISSYTSHTIMSSRGNGMPLSKQIRHRTLPTWIRSNAQLMKNRPSLKLDTLSMHLMDHGSGANALITIRAIDSEKEGGKLSLEERSRCGVLGRILDSIWTKLLLINSADGAADIAGELDESPMTLMSFISMMVHSFSMESMSSLDYWMNMVEQEIKDMAVSKHSSHLAEMSRITKDFKDYVDPFLTTLSGFLSEWEKETESFMKAASAVVRGGGGGGENDVHDFNHQEKLDRSTYMRPSIFPVPTSNSQEKGESLNTSNHQISKDKGSPRSSGNGSIQMRRVSRMHMMTALHETPSVFANTTTLMELEKMPLSYSVVKVFMGDACYRDLRILLEGYELLEMKGLVDWQQRIDKYEIRLQEMRRLIATQLEEKRNFTTFLLTIVTTVLAPLTILTGYFGMNFDNMYELHPETYPLVPGVKLVWAIAGFLYFLMLLFAMHFRVIYSAT